MYTGAVRTARASFVVDAVKTAAATLQPTTRVHYWPQFRPDLGPNHLYTCLPQCLSHVMSVQDQFCNTITGSTPLLRSYDTKPCLRAGDDYNASIPCKRLVKIMQKCLAMTRQMHQTWVEGPSLLTVGLRLNVKRT